MKKCYRIISVILSVIAIITMFAVPASAASSLKNAILLKENNTVTLSASVKDSTYTYKIKLTSSGKISFLTSSSKTNVNTKMYLLDSNGKKLISKSFNDFVKLKVKVSKKGTYYLKIKLKKNQSIKGFGYKFSENSDNVTSKNSDWDKNYKLKQNDIDRITRIIEYMCLGRVNDGCFKEGSLTEKEAMKKIVSFDSFIRYYSEKPDANYLNRSWETTENPYSDPLGKYYSHFWVKESIVDGVLYDLFGIKASHKYTSESSYYIHNGYYYFPQYAGGGGYSQLKYASTESLDDGRFIIKYGIYDWENGKLKYAKRDLYVLTSMHSSNGNCYPRIHAISNKRSSLVK